MEYPVIRTIRLKVRAEAYPWLNAAAVEVNPVFNWCNATTIDASDRGRRSIHARFLSGFELCNLSAGASEYYDYLLADVIQRICIEYAGKRATAQKPRLEWRKSFGAHRARAGCRSRG